MNIIKLRLPHLVTRLLAISAFSLTIACHSTAADSMEQLKDAANLLRNNRNQEALQAALQVSPDGPRNLLAGEAAMRLKRYDEALLYLTEAERNYPLLADLAAAMRGEALYNLGRFEEAAAVARSVAEKSAVAATVRRMEKLAADALFYSGDYRGALDAYQLFAAKYQGGNDRIDALFQAARCQEMERNQQAAVKGYRTIYLQFPASTQGGKSFEQLKQLEKNGLVGCSSFSPQELLERSVALLAANQAGAAAWSLAAIPRQDLSDNLLAMIELKSGQVAMKQRNYLLAEQFLKRAAAYRNSPTVYEASLNLARVEIRRGDTEKGVRRLQGLAVLKKEGGDIPLLDAALALKQSGRFADAAPLFRQLVKEYPGSELRLRSEWELAWGSYLAGDLVTAEEFLTKLQGDDRYREQAVYWLARLKERQGRRGEAVADYVTLLKEYPFGFYAAWYRQKNGINSGWLPIPDNLQEPSFPEGTERIQALARLGMLEKARVELAEFRQQGVKPELISGLSRLQQLAGDLHGSIVTFHRNRPESINQENLPFWSLGYPRPYAALFNRYSAENNVPELLVLSLAKAESSFRADVKSHAGAIGLMQLMPATAKMTAGYKGKNYNPLWLTDPEYNIRLGTRHLRDLLNQYSADQVYTLAAYNAGAGAVKRWRNTFGELERDEFIENIPYQETRDYVKKIVGYMDVYAALYRLK